MLLPRLPRPATVLAFAALVISLTGSAIAAKKYLITSTKQIKPSVLAQLRGNTGPAGPKGDTGAPGAKGDTGAAGAKGDTGAAGTNGIDGTSGGTTSEQTVADEVTTTSTSDVDLGGPSVTVNIPAGGAMVLLGASFDAKTTDAAQFAVADFSVDGTAYSFALSGPGATNVGNTSGIAIRSTTYGTPTGTYPLRIGAGSHTFSLRYKSTNASSTASFKNRTLSVTVLG